MTLSCRKSTTQIATYIIWVFCTQCVIDGAASSREVLVVERSRRRQLLPHVRLVSDAPPVLGLEVHLAVLSVVVEVNINHQVVLRIVLYINISEFKK